MSCIPTVDAFVLASISDICNIDPSTLDLDCDLGELGLDSIRRMQIVARIEVGLGLELTSREVLAFFAARTPVALVRLVEQISNRQQPSSLVGARERESAFAPRPEANAIPDVGDGLAR